MIDELYHIFNQQIPISLKQFEPFKKILKTKSFKKGNLILKIGEIDSQINFLASGIVHQYMMVNDNLVTLNIKISGMYFNCLKSYVEQTPSFEVQEAITDVEIIYFEKKAFENLLKQEHWLTYVYAKSTEQVLLERENRAFILQHQSAFERFKLFIETNKNAQRYILEVSQKLIAQYLAMAPETFSKVKKAYFKKNMLFS